MPKYHQVEQASDAWDRLRIGIPTSSNFKKILTPEGKPSKSWEAYAHHLLAEKVLGRKVDTYTAPQMEYGMAMEGDAVAWYEFEKGLDVAPGGFVTTDDGLIGCSPDRLVGDDGLLEVKCPQPQTQMGYLLTGKVDKEYKPQLQGQLFVTGRKWVDILAWHPELPRICIRVERDDAYIACMEAHLWEFNSYMRLAWAKIQQMALTKPEEQKHEPQEIQY